MGHQHCWQSEPPEGKLSWSKSFDQRYRDEEDLAANAVFNSPEEIQRLRLLLKKDPSLETSSSWPHLVEWCVTCTSTRAVKLQLPVEEKEPVVDTKFEEEKNPSCKMSDASTQTPKRRRSGGKASRMRRLLAFQLMLTEKRGLPKSRLLTLKEADARQSEREESLWMQEESASPLLRRRKATVVKADKELEEVNTASLDLEKEEEGNINVGTWTGDLPIFTPRSSQTNPTSSTPITPMQAEASFLPPSTTSFMWVPCTPLTTFCTPSPCGPMPGHQWVMCGNCQSWGTVIMSQ